MLEELERSVESILDELRTILVGWGLLPQPIPVKVRSRRKF
jgi:hypothetical protein